MRDSYEKHTAYSSYHADVRRLPLSFNPRGRSDIFKTFRAGAIEHMVQTDNDKVPFFKIRTNKHNLYQGCKVALELPKV
jgi:hypothetical protein